MRSTKMFKNRRGFYQGKYQVHNVSKYVGPLNDIEFRSSWELFFMQWLDHNPNVEQWSSEGVVINYFSQLDSKSRRYFIDFYVKYVDGKEFLYEIKPYKQTRPPKPPKKQNKKAIQRFRKEYYDFNVNLDKWITAQKYAKDYGKTFKVITEKDLQRMGLQI